MDTGHEVKLAKELLSLSNEFDNKFWEDICWNAKLSRPFIRKFKNKLDWYALSSSVRIFSIPFIREFKDYIDWHTGNVYNSISMNEKLLLEFEDYIDWEYISYYKNLPLKIIRKFRHRLDWREIYLSRKLSNKFIKEFKKELMPYLEKEYKELMSQ